MQAPNKKRLLIFASGGKESGSGGSGFQTMVEKSRTNPPELDADIIAVISNYPSGGVFEKAQKLGIPFEYWPGPFTGEGYQNIINKYKPDFIMLSGWLKKTIGLDPATTINIHPGPLPKFGGQGLYGHFVHEAVIKAYQKDQRIQSAVSIHFVTEEFDKGPIIVRVPVAIEKTDTPETLAKRVNDEEKRVQSLVLNWIIQGLVKLNGTTTIWVNPKIWEQYISWFNAPGQKYEVPSHAEKN